MSILALRKKANRYFKKLNYDVPLSLINPYEDHKNALPGSDRSTLAIHGLIKAREELRDVIDHIKESCVYYHCDLVRGHKKYKEKQSEKKHPFLVLFPLIEKNGLSDEIVSQGNKRIIYLSKGRISLDHDLLGIKFSIPLGYNVDNKSISDAVNDQVFHDYCRYKPCVRDDLSFHILSATKDIGLRYSEKIFSTASSLKLKVPKNSLTEYFIKRHRCKNSKFSHIERNTPYFLMEEYAYIQENNIRHRHGIAKELNRYFNGLVSYPSGLKDDLFPRTGSCLKRNPAERLSDSLIGINEKIKSDVQADVSRLQKSVFPYQRKVESLKELIEDIESEIDHLNNSAISHIDIPNIQLSNGHLSDEIFHLHREFNESPSYPNKLQKSGDLHRKDQFTRSTVSKTILDTPSFAAWYDLLQIGDYFNPETGRYSPALNTSDQVIRLMAFLADDKIPHSEKINIIEDVFDNTQKGLNPLNTLRMELVRYGISYQTDPQTALIKSAASYRNLNAENLSFLGKRDDNSESHFTDSEFAMLIERHGGIPIHATDDGNILKIQDVKVISSSTLKNIICAFQKADDYSLSNHPIKEMSKDEIDGHRPK
jgi:hypothetical protein